MSDETRQRAAADKGMATRSSRRCPRLPDAAKPMVQGWPGTVDRPVAEGRTRRAFMREGADILVLDEPTSAMDAEAESMIFDRVRQLTENQIAVLISHRFSTVRMADRIVVLEDGTIVEEGDHGALMEAKGATRSCSPSRRRVSLSRSCSEAVGVANARARLGRPLALVEDIGESLGSAVVRSEPRCPRARVVDLEEPQRSRERRRAAVGGCGGCLRPWPGRSRSVRSRLAGTVGRCWAGRSRDGWPPGGSGGRPARCVVGPGASRIHLDPVAQAGRLHLGEEYALRGRGAADVAEADEAHAIIGRFRSGRGPGQGGEAGRSVWIQARAPSWTSARASVP